jgi:hypothetical protein
MYQRNYTFSRDANKKQGVINEIGENTLTISNFQHYTYMLSPKLLSMLVPGDEVLYKTNARNNELLFVKVIKWNRKLRKQLKECTVQPVNYPD